MANSEEKDWVEDKSSLTNAAGRRAILKALAAAGPVILTVTPFHARANYVNGVYQVGSVCNPHDDRDKNKCKPKT
jgi:hypothetical protein